MSSAQVRQNQIELMLGLQDEMNTKVHPQWREQHYPWYRAIWLESAEMLDHYGWKWWKKQTPDVDQVTLELVDIWHFGLSQLILQGVSAQAIQASVEQAEQTTCQQHFAELLEAFVAATLASKGFDVPGFVKLMQSINLSFDQLYKSYIGKNVLNFFRQDHGYKDGSYRKLWSGREDNEHLVEILLELRAEGPDFKDQLYQALLVRYRQSD